MNSFGPKMVCTKIKPGAAAALRSGLTLLVAAISRSMAEAAKADDVEGPLLLDGVILPPASSSVSESLDEKLAEDVLMGGLLLRFRLPPPPPD